MKTKCNLAIQLALAALLLTACAPATGPADTTPPPGSEQVEMDTSSRSAINTASDVPWERYQPPTTPASLELDFHLEDGEFRTFPALSPEEREAFLQSDDYLQQFFSRLEENGIRLAAEDYTAFFPEKFYNSPYHFTYPFTVSHYGDFDLLAVTSSSGYRSNAGNDLFVFQNGQYKGCVSILGSIDCYWELRETVWLVYSVYGTGTGIGTTSETWINLSAPTFPEELHYTSFYGCTSLSIYYDIGIAVYLDYSVRETNLFLSDQDIPMLKVSWDKTVYSSDDTGRKVVTLTDSGTEEYPIGAPVEYETFEAKNNAYFLGLEDQYRACIQTGTEEQRHIAQQMLDYFSQD